MRFFVLIGWIGFFIFFVLPLFFSVFKKSAPRKETLEKGSDMVRDQICGVYIPKDRAEKLQSRGEVHYFCSKECQSKFLAGTG